MEQQLKQRLAGAIVLVSLAVIFIPVILEGPRDEWAPRDHTIPEPPAMRYDTSTELPIPSAGDEPPVARPVAEVVAGAAPAALPLPPPAPEAAGPAAEAPLKPAPQKPVVTATVKQSPAAGWYVQVGSFSQSVNARRLRDQLRTEGLDAYLQSTRTNRGTGFRVLVGPSTSRAKAEKLQRKLAASRKTKGIVIEISATEG